MIVLADPGALVSVDERLVGVLPLPSPLLLSPGDHRLVIEYPNKRLSGQVAISAGRQFEVRFDRGTGTLLVSLLPAILTVNDLGTTLPEAQSDLATTIEQSVRSVEQTVLPVDQALLSAPHLRDCTGKANCQQLLAQKVDVSTSFMRRCGGWTRGRLLAEAGGAASRYHRSSGSGRDQVPALHSRRGCEPARTHVAIAALWCSQTEEQYLDGDDPAGVR